MHIAIIGNGISGITAARHIRKHSNHKISVISSETDHFFSRTALMYIYMGHMRYKETKPYEDHFWEKNRINLIRDYVHSINFKGKKLQLKNQEISYDKLILAVGSTPNKFGWPGQDLDGVQGLYAYQDVETMEHWSKDLKHAVIVGGGLIGIEMAEMFLSRKIPVTFLVREKSYWNGVLPSEESAMINRHIEAHHADLKLSTELKEILPDKNGRVRAVITNKGEEIECQFVGLTAGVHPNINFLKDSELALAKGILVNEYLETNIPDVYAIGDCAQMQNPRKGRRPIEAVWYTGRMMGETVAHTICKKKTVYNPGIWFNSAKFFDIEYQVYGDVPAKLPEDYKTLYWEHPEGNRAIRILYHKNTNEVVGFNLMGIRYRHEVCEQWLANKTHIEEVLQHLSLANFDPEFYSTYEKDLVQKYNQQNGRELVLSNRSSTDAVAFFLGKNTQSKADIQQGMKRNLMLGILLILLSFILPFLFTVKLPIMIVSGLLVGLGIGLLLLSFSQRQVLSGLE